MLFDPDVFFKVGPYNWSVECEWIDDVATLHINSHRQDARWLILSVGSRTYRVVALSGRSATRYGHPVGCLVGVTLRNLARNVRKRLS